MIIWLLEIMEELINPIQYCSNFIWYSQNWGLILCESSLQNSNSLYHHIFCAQSWVVSLYYYDMINMIDQMFDGMKHGKKKNWK
jgi:hypothetical protein